MSNPDFICDPKLLSAAVAAANKQRRPLFIIFLATKPCYIKLASLVFALQKRQLPFVVADTNQHYEGILTGARQELAYDHLVGVHLNIRGGIVERTADLAHKLKRLAVELRAAGLHELPVPVVSGDTSSAAFVPAFWYLLTGCRSVHVEAGLRSFTPEMDWDAQRIETLISQRERRWKKNLNEPFPEGIDTVLGSVASDLLLAPVQQNVDNLIAEGYASEKIHIVGSLSADAVELVSDDDEKPLSPMVSELQSDLWIRADIHRRENATPARLEPIIRGLTGIAKRGFRVVLIRTNAIRTAAEDPVMRDLLIEAERNGVLVQGLWPTYADVVRFMRSRNCRLIFTDSGGLQEETNVLNVPCITCRFSTDRPETVLEGNTNLLLPPISAEFVEQALQLVLSNTEKVWPEPQQRKLYGFQVGERIASVMSEYEPPAVATGAEFSFSRNPGNI